MEGHSRKRVPGLTGTGLKVIAMVSMAVDHTAVALVWPAASAGPAESGLYFLYWVMRAAGRLAFPIYGFLLVQGFLHTSSRKRYLGRLCAFALISEVPFDLIIAGRVFDPGVQNVFFTLAAAMGTIWVLERLEERGHTGDTAGTLAEKCSFAWLPIAAAGGLAAWLLRGDYGFLGVMFAAVVWRFRGEPEKRLAGELVSLGLLGVGNLPCLLAIPLTEKYNGQRGPRLGLWAYWFYPLHLLVLKGLQMVI
ncbi:MAG TPA: conjugal transfer protein TraX [Candidatus Lachnoclostridium pullistercoris]|uniref:Conjugal transfer protein TraX n=1 Tax=Candidatus Lachnoclostridium pullistercoris TaxID=2838632 RepID=A0A9D2PEK7_9FIRM|nr:conjugal transfer protein TraX [Candidatus Lachnoclostridium pullistercoris]